MSKIEEFMTNLILKDFSSNQKLHQVCLYSFQGGKKLRPMIIISIVDSLQRYHQNKKVNCLHLAAAIEFIHSASLIIDDIIDKDTMRRQKQSVYHKFGIELAQMASVYLISLAFRCMSFAVQDLKECFSEDDANKRGIYLYDTYSVCLHQLGLGQYSDMFPHNVYNLSELTPNQIKDIITKKTSSLFEMCFLSGFIAADPSFLPDKSEEIKSLARQFGFCYQIFDDFKDYQQDLEKGSEINYVINVGHSNAYQEYNNQIANFEKQLREHHCWSEAFEKMILHMNALVDKYYV